MLRSLLFLALASVASVGHAIAGDNGPVAAAACRIVVENALLQHGHDVRSVELCNTNQFCHATQRLIEQRHRPAIPGLTCADASTATSEAEAHFFRPIFENACKWAAVGIITGGIVGNLQDQIALCNQHPDKSSCQDTIAFIKKNHQGDAGGVTCQYP